MNAITTTITPKRRTFVNAFTGDSHDELISAMKVSGFRGNDLYLKAQALKFLNDPVMVKAIQERDNYREFNNNTVATLHERKTFWSDIMRNQDNNAVREYDKNNMPKKANIPLGSRIKASELLGKAETDFVEKIDISGTITITDIVKESYKLSQSDKVEDSLEYIEAQYKLSQNTEEVEDAEFTEVDKPDEDVAPSLDTFI